MTKRDFFRLLIKIFGLYSLIIAVFNILPQNLSFVLTYPVVESLVFLSVILMVLVLLLVFLIFKSDLIINWFKLDKGFDDERIEFGKIRSYTIVMVSVIIIGGIMLVENIPSFISNLYYTFKSDISGNEISDDSYIILGTSFFNLLMGYLLLVNHKKLGLWIKQQEQKNKS